MNILIEKEYLTEQMVSIVYTYHAVLSLRTCVSEMYAFIWVGLQKYRLPKRDAMYQNQESFVDYVNSELVRIIQDHQLDVDQVFDFVEGSFDDFKGFVNKQTFKAFDTKNE